MFRLKRLDPSGKEWLDEFARALELIDAEINETTMQYVGFRVIEITMANVYKSVRWIPAQKVSWRWDPDEPIAVVGISIYRWVPGTYTQNPHRAGELIDRDYTFKLGGEAERFMIREDKPIKLTYHTPDEALICLMVDIAEVIVKMIDYTASTGTKTDGLDAVLRSLKLSALR